MGNRPYERLEEVLFIFMEQPASTTPLLDMVSQITATDLFKVFDSSMLQGLESELRRVRLAAGDVLMRQSDPGDSMYILIRGRLSVTIQHADGAEQVVDELAPGASIGELALLTGQLRTASVTAIHDSELVQLSRAAFDRLAEKDPAAMRHFAEAMVPRMRRKELVSALKNLFGNVGPSALQELEPHLEWQHLRHGEALFKQGDPGDALFFVINGRLREVIEDEDGSTRDVTEVVRGASIGEFALVTGESRTTSVYAIRDTDVVRFPNAVFERLLEKYPRTMIEITRSIVNRIRQTDRSVRAHAGGVVTFALLPVSNDVPLLDFAQHLAEVLATFGPTLYLDSQRFDQLFGKPGAAQIPEDHPTRITLASWLSDQETKYRYIVYEADTDWSNWTSRCVGQADRVLLVGHGATPPNPAAIDSQIKRLGVLARQELVLLHPSGTHRPTGTRQWLTACPVFTHHHVRLNSDQDIRRLARRLTGRALGLVLGGGGARGYAHIGVIRALEELGLPIDLIGGTSMGAIMGGLYALEMEPVAIMEAAKRFGSARQLKDYTLPFVALFASKKVTNIFRALFEEVQIEDLWRPFFCVSSNLTQAKPVVHRQGPMWKYVRASSALPGIFSPVLDNGDILVDGVSMDNLPVEDMRDLTEGGPVIAVNIVPEYDLQERYDFGYNVSGWQILWSKLNPFAQPVRPPSIVATLLRAREVNDVYRRQFKRSLVDLYLSPSLDQFPLLDFSRSTEIAEVGYQEARRALQAWLRTRQVKESTDA